MLYIGNAITNIGNVKAVNQDSLTLKIANVKNGMICLAVICDGLGGLQQGEVASSCVIRSFDEWFRKNIIDLYEVQTESAIEQAWKELLFFVNRKIQAYGHDNGIKLGTTMTAVLFTQTKYYVLHVGDCRLYKIKNSVKQLTRDHTIGNEIMGSKVDLTKTGGYGSNVLSQCIGTDDNIKPDFIVGDVEPDSAYLICTDGFRHLITNKEIFEYCNIEKNATDANIKDNLEYLTALNMERGERDNISAILVISEDEG